MSHVRAYLDALLASPLARQVTCHRVFPASEAVYGEPIRPWSRAVSGLLEAQGLRLYSHQCRATDLLRAGRDLVLATPTASGKSLCYMLPFLERSLHDPDVRALWLFPLKALAQDQRAAFMRLTEVWPEAARPSIALYDGDVSAHARKKIRTSPPQVLITNPEMLHLALLPNHQSWATFFASLAFVVVDEAHSYRGVSGAHLAQLLRRLGRLCALYGARPAHFFATATVGNPAELGAALLGQAPAGVGSGGAGVGGETAGSGAVEPAKVGRAGNESGKGGTSERGTAERTESGSAGAGSAEAGIAGRGLTERPLSAPEGTSSAAAMSIAASPYPAPVATPTSSPVAGSDPASASAPDPASAAAPDPASVAAPVPAPVAASAPGLPVVSLSGAPTGTRHYVFLNPDDSPSSLAIQLLRAALARELRTIVYCRSRGMTERLALWAADKAGALKNRISAYRAGFLPEERRDIEARMASGELLAVISTSALELGIDIGGLDLCILVGYPGTIMATLQRGGRVGRAGQESAVLLVAGEDALDQYFIRQPEAFFEGRAERAVVNPDNEVILARHLECAAAERALQATEPWLHSAAARAALHSLEQEGLLLRSAAGDAWLAARKRPQRHVDLRGCGACYTLLDPAETPIGSVDGHRVWSETHPGALYLHRGKQYVITRIDPATHTVRAEPVPRAKWFTRARSVKTTEILKVIRQDAAFGAPVGFGTIRVTETVTGYEKRSFDNKLLTIVPLTSPPQIFETEGFWLHIPEAVQRGLEDELFHFMGAIHALEHAMIGLMPLCVMADRNDFGGISTPMHAQLGSAGVFVYDGLPGGAGLCRDAFSRQEALLAAVRDLLIRCPCETGCPSCVHSPKCGSGNRPIDKAAALALIQRLCAAPPPATLPRIAPCPAGRSDFGPPFASGVAPSLSASPFTASTLSSGGAPSLTSGATPSFSTSSFAEVPVADVSVQAGVSGDPALPSAPPSAEPPSVPHGTTGRGLAVPLSDLAASGPAAVPAAPPASKILPRRFMVLDVETRRSAAEVGGWNLANRMGVSVAVLYDAAPDDFVSYSQDELTALFARLRESDLVIGFNSLRFDYAVLQPFASYDLHTLPSLDLLDHIKRRLSYRVSLDNLASATLNAPKSADGLQALAWWKEGRLDELAHYCQKDVEITRDLYLFGRREGYLLFTNKARQAVRVPVDW